MQFTPHIQRLHNSGLHDVLHHDILLSLPLSFHWIQQATLFPHPQYLKQKLPLYVYVGVSFLSQGNNNRIASCHLWNRSQSKYQSVEANTLLPRPQVFLEALSTLFPGQPLECSIVSDVAPGRGLGLHHSIATLLATIAHLQLGTISLEECTGHPFPNHKLPTILRTATQVYQHYTGDVYSHTFYPAGIAPGFSPVLCSSDAFTPVESFSTPMHSASNPPFHIALLYCGKESDISLQQTRTTKLQQLLSRHNSTAEHSASPYSTVNNYLSYLTQQLLSTFIALREDGPLQEHQQQLHHILDAALSQQHLTNELGPQQHTLLRHLQHIRHNHPQYAMSFCPIGMSKMGGSTVVLFQDPQVGELLEQFTHQYGSEGFLLEYLSTKDLPSPESGMECLRHKDTHPNTLGETGQIYLQHANTEGYLQDRYVNSIAYEQLLAHSDLFLDLDLKRIFIRGRKLTAKELPTQSATLQLFLLLLSQPQFKLHNSQLPKSSYSMSKNEMTSKVLIPLKKTVKQLLQKDLHLNCSGQLSNFSIQLQLQEEMMVTIKPNSYQEEDITT